MKRSQVDPAAMAKIKRLEVALAAAFELDDYDSIDSINAEIAELWSPAQDEDE